MKTWYKLTLKRLLCLMKHRSMKTSWRVDLYLLPPLILVADWGQESASCPGYFTRDENSGYSL